MIVFYNSKTGKKSSPPQPDNAIELFNFHHPHHTIL